MGTLVAPIGSAAVAMPAASRWSDRLAALVLEARLSMSWRESKGRRGQRRRGEGSSCGRLLLGRSDEFITADWVRTGPPNMSASSALPASPSPAQQSPPADWPARVSRLPSRLACTVRLVPDARAHGGDTHSPRPPPPRPLRTDHVAQPPGCPRSSTATHAGDRTEVDRKHMAQIRPSPRTPGAHSGRSADHPASSPDQSPASEPSSRRVLRLGRELRPCPG